MVGILLSYWEGLFSGAMLVSGMVVIDVNSIIDSWGLEPLLMFCFESMDDEKNCKKQLYI